MRENTPLDRAAADWSRTCVTSSPHHVTDDDDDLAESRDERDTAGRRPMAHGWLLGLSLESANRKRCRSGVCAITVRYSQRSL